MQYFEDLSIGDVAVFGSYQVTEEEIIDFACRYDPQAFHVDPDAAKKTSVGGLIASGWHTCAIFMRMFVDHYMQGGSGMPSPGIDELRWLQPVRPDDTLSVRITVQSLRRSKSRPDRGIIGHFCEILNQRKEVVMTMTSNGFLPTREQDTTAG